MLRPSFALVASAAALACGAEVPVFDGEPYRRDPPQVGSLQGRIVTTNNYDDTLSVLDPNVPGPAGRLPIGFNPVDLEGPHHVSVDPQGRFLYVNLSLAVEGSGSGPHGLHGSGEVPGYVLKIDAATAQTVAWVQVDTNPGDNALSKDGRTLYVTHYDFVRWAKAGVDGDYRRGDSNLVLVDTETMLVKARIPVCPAAHGIGLSPDETTVYTTCGPDEIAVVDLRLSPPAARRVLFPGAAEGAGCQVCPYALAVAPDGLVWVSGLGPSGGRMGRGIISLFDPELGGGGGFDTRRLVRLRGSPVFATFVPQGNGYRAYVPEQGPSILEDWIRVYELDGPERPPREIAALQLGRGDCISAHMILATEGGQTGHLICEGNRGEAGQFLWLKLDPLEVLGSVPIGQFPDGMAYVPFPR
jgi:DNA-binding beta-propeller fold protein YncE